MAKGVFVHRADSKYDDFPEERYQFPRRYYNRAINFENDWIVYYEPRGGGGRLGYTAIAVVQKIMPDPSRDGMFIARIKPQTFLPFEEFVPFRTAEGFMESALRKPGGSLNGGLIQWAIRPISDADFNSIVLKGFPEDSNILPRKNNEIQPQKPFEIDDTGSEYDYDDERSRVERTILNIPRDRAFRKVVLKAYKNSCAITGLNIINGGGRAEVEAAHIKPVAADGPDTVRNGIALSGTVHWMFDRGLISLSDNLDIMISRQINNANQIRSLINKTGRAIPPNNPGERPHPKYLSWHREYCFKV
jgi:putative restriction endonuclease